MARIFITGSADGLGLLAAKKLISQHHQVVLHARNDARAKSARSNAPGAETVLIGDLSDAEETKSLAAEVNKLGHFDAIIHNAGVYQVSNKLTFAVNSLAPFILTSLINKPKRLIYLSSGMHRQGQLDIDNLNTETGTNYSDSKLHVLMLGKAVAELWPDVYSNSVDPGWVPTKMGGRNAPDDLEKGAETQVWLATSNDSNALVSGQYFHHKKTDRSSKIADDLRSHQSLIKKFEEITGVKFLQSNS